MTDQKKTGKRCFVICPVGEAGSEIRERSNDVFDNLVRPIAEAAGYTAHRVIDNDRPGDITDKIIGDITAADAIVADITGHNPNVFYEMAIAHAWKKPCILLSGDGARVPFDIASQNVIALRMDNFGAFEATKALVAKHFAEIADGKAGLENPVARFERNEALEKSGDPLAAEVAELREVVEGLKADKLSHEMAAQAINPRLSPACRPGKIRKSGVSTETKNELFKVKPKPLPKGD